MSKYLELIAQAEALKAEAEVLRKEEMTEIIADIKNKVKAYGLTASDIGFGAPPSRKPAKTPVVHNPKYRGPNGELWAGGLGRKPNWVRVLIEKGEDIEQYLIKE